MTATRHPQFCALARAAEILGERWTLLLVRELLLGSQRFSDLRQRLDGISPTVLSERLAKLEEAGLVERRFLAPPAASTVYELTDDGRALEGVVFALIRWGARYLLPPRRGERVEPDWVALALAACARTGPSPSRSYELRVVGGGTELVIHIEGGPDGVKIDHGPGAADARIVGAPEAVLGLMSGALKPVDALRERRIHVEGDRRALGAFSDLFDITIQKGG